MHLTLLGLIAGQLQGLWPPIGFLIYAAVVFGIAAVVWQVWERPFLNLKSRFA